MKIEAPNALHFIFQDDIYLLNEDKNYYSTATDPQPGIETPEVNFNYLGANKKNFLILVNYPEHEFIAADHLAALESVLGRKGHNRDDVALLNLDKHAFADYAQLITYFEPKTLVLLGKKAIPPGMEQPRFNLWENRAGINLLYTFSFDEMMTNNDNKKAFWDQMKTL